MTKLAYLHEPGVLQNLRSRYDINEIYTFTGNILIAVNHFQRLTHPYSNHMMEQYKGMALGELSPHPFAIADAYRKMINEGISLSILVNEESGAGKTESTEMLMSYFAHMGGRAAAEGRTAEQQVLEVPCFQELTCERKCLKVKDCERHACKRRCCDGDCPPCSEVCDKRLICRNHKCPAPCHRCAMFGDDQLESVS